MKNINQIIAALLFTLIVLHVFYAGYYLGILWLFNFEPVIPQSIHYYFDTNAFLITWLVGFIIIFLLTRMNRNNKPSKWLWILWFIIPFLLGTAAARIGGLDYVSEPTRQMYLG